MSDARSEWDVVVVGAGPAGAVAARQLARRGAAVLLVDKAKFPRDKVCGCCINAAALQALESIGLGRLPASLGATNLSRFHLCAHRRQAALAIPQGVSLSRRALDHALTLEAVRAGVTFRPSTIATLSNVDDRFRYVRLQHGADNQIVAARLVLAADGLDSRLLHEGRSVRPTLAGRSRMGVAAICDDGGHDYRPGHIYMACGRGGYVGVVRLEDGKLNVAAAVDPKSVKRIGGPGPASASILVQAGLTPINDLTHQTWRGTGCLNRRRLTLGTHRVLVLGDAAGYVEPFTGEGITWALASAQAITEPAMRGVGHWQADIVRQWSCQHRQLVGRRQRICRLIRRPLRHPAFVAAVITVLRGAPGLVRPLLGAINAPMVAAEGS